VAIFLALGLGLLAGTTVVDQGLVSLLKEQSATANRTTESLQQEFDDLQTELGRSQDFIERAVPALEKNRLLGSRVVLVTDEGVSGPIVEGVRRDLEAAGADVMAILSLTPRATVSDPQTREALADILGVPASTSPDQLDQGLAAQLASRLSTGPQGDQDLLLQLLEGGFLDGKGAGLKQVGNQLPAVGGPGRSVVVVSGGSGQPPVAPGSFLLPLTGSLAREGVRTAAAEGAAAEYGFVTVLRSEGVADGKRIVTVDDVDEPAGRLAVVMGLQDLVRTGQGGNFGIKPGVGDPAYPPLEA